MRLNPDFVYLSLEPPGVAIVPESLPEARRYVVGEEAQLTVESNLGTVSIIGGPFWDDRRIGDRVPRPPTRTYQVYYEVPMPSGREVEIGDSVLRLLATDYTRPIRLFLSPEVLVPTTSTLVVRKFRREGRLWNTASASCPASR